MKDNFELSQVESPLLPTEFDTAWARLRKNVQIWCQGYENEKRRALFKRYLDIYLSRSNFVSLFQSLRIRNRSTVQTLAKSLNKELRRRHVSLL